KTNFLELLSYPVLFRSLRGARDVDLVRQGEEGRGFHLSLEAATAEGEQVLDAAFVRDGRSKRIAVDGVEPERLTDAIGRWLSVRLEYGGRSELADEACWSEALARSRPRDAAVGGTTIGPHRDDLVLLLEGAPLRSIGSTGQQRTAAVALKLLERDTLWRARGTEPALLLDDVFAELDRDRQERLAERIAPPPEGGRQVFVTAPREDE